LRQAITLGESQEKNVNRSHTKNTFMCGETKPRAIRRIAGFSLLEILVTIVIFSLGILALAATQVLNIKGTGFNKDAGVATGLAQKRLEDLKNTAFDSIAANTTGVTERGMNVSWSVTTSGTAPHRYKDVAVTVAWEGKSISCYTIITEP